VAIACPQSFGRARVSAQQSTRKGKFAAKINAFVQQLGGSLLDTEVKSPIFSLGPVPRCTEASDLRSRPRHFTIITTAALPWLTGTSVNPLLRALYLAKTGRETVLVIPWLEIEDQQKVFPGGKTFDDPKAQEKAIIEWCHNRAKIDPGKVPLKFSWYRAAYVPTVRSVFPKGDPSEELGADDPRDVLVLEEPEHLCWYHLGKRWTEVFPHVIGIVHTNYQDYLVQQGAAGSDDAARPVTDVVPDSFKETAVFAASTLVCSAHCDVNIKLSDTIMPLPNEVTCNVHGVRQEFLTIGDACSRKNPLQELTSKMVGGSGGPKAESESAPAYYLGKALYEKGWGELLTLVELAGSKLQGLRIDGFGSGINYDDIIERAGNLKEDWAQLSMHPGLDHADEVIHGYGVLVNPSTSDVLCTVTVEALAMGKRVVLARHPSNRFFQEYFEDRTHFFNAGEVDSFVAAVKAAVAAGPPQPLPEESRHVLTWEAANERLFTSAEVRVLSGPYQRPSEAASARLAYRMHNDLMQDRTMSELIKEATLGDATPWDKNLEEWRSHELEEMPKADRGRAAPMSPMQDWEKSLQDRTLELGAKVRKKIEEIVK